MAKTQIHNYVFKPGIGLLDNLYPNAWNLLTKNKNFLLSEYKEYLNAQIADAEINRRDVGLIIDGAAFDVALDTTYNAVFFKNTRNYLIAHNTTMDRNNTRVKNKILPAEARNIGVKYSNKNSKFISFCDSDDVIKPEKTETQIDIMLEEDLNASCTNVDFYDQLTGKIKKNFFMIPYNFIDFEILSFKNLIATSSVILTKKIFNSVNGFSESKYFYSFEDYFLWLKVTNKCKFRFIDQNLTIYRDDRKNSASSNSKHIIEQRIRLILFYLSKFEFYNLKNLILGNFLLVKSWFLRKFLKRNRSEYFDLL